jgi:eukaryotic-like serine/threonine-protein kinase
MDLWTEYEGRTIGGVYPLTKLIRPEGRSAFFSTSNGTGSPTVIRLIESHFDGDEILTRWRAMAALNHPNLVKLKSFGHQVVDETSLVYAVMEPVDANLAETVRERRLTEEEARELATSLLGAIGALHANGFVHEHVEAANVLAVGEMVKLRSDCIRETPEGEDGRALKRKDVRDFAVVLQEALTQGKTSGAALPAPFEQIVRKGMSGEWGLSQIDAALEGKAATVMPAVRAAAAAPMTPVMAEARDEKRVDAMPGPAPSVSRRIRTAVGERRRGIGARGAAYLVGIVFLVLLGWFFVRGRSGAPAEADSAKVPVMPQDTTAAEKAPKAGSSLPPAAAIDFATTASSTSGTGRWRVIAFTYNYEAQARQKAAEIAGSHPDLSPTVFTPTGRAPFLVALGGPMSKQDAFALSGKAKREGLPRDVYAQNYRGSGR